MPTLSCFCSASGKPANNHPRLTENKLDKDRMRWQPNAAVTAGRRWCGCGYRRA